MLVPSLLLKQLYTFGSLANTDQGVKFSLKNRLSDATITGVRKVMINGNEFGHGEFTLVVAGKELNPKDISKSNPIDFPLRSIVDIHAKMDHLDFGKHPLEVHFDAKPFGKLKLKVDGSIEAKNEDAVVIPRSTEDDYDEEIIKIRQDFVEKITGKKLEHTTHYSFDPHILSGNCEHFTGVAQIPMGFAGPLQIDGEHAKGEFII
ncbi:MAG: hydroxymethylglutaryl-CoA reductase, partial [Bacteroidota bacterium]